MARRFIQLILNKNSSFQTMLYELALRLYALCAKIDFRDNPQRAIVFPSILWYSITQISVFGRYMDMPERNMVNLTITMTREESMALKQLALDKDITVSALIRLWLQEYQKTEVNE